MRVKFIGLLGDVGMVLIISHLLITIILILPKISIEQSIVKDIVNAVQIELDFQITLDVFLANQMISLSDLNDKNLFLITVNI